MTQKDTAFVASWEFQGRFECDDCGQEPSDQRFIPVQWAVGSTGHVGIQCGCASNYENKATVSEDGMAVAHWEIA